jgi:hypothetical protein
MERRAFLATTAVGVAGLAGCAGGSVEKSVKRTITVTPGEGWIADLPDVDNGALSYIARGRSRFDVYLFDDEAYAQYDAFTAGAEPGSMPRGVEGFSKTAVRTDGGDKYLASSANDGARQSLPGNGPYYFVVDHSDYGQGTPLHEDAGPIQVFVNLEVVEKTLPL